MTLYLDIDAREQIHQLKDKRRYIQTGDPFIKLGGGWAMRRTHINGWGDARWELRYRGRVMASDFGTEKACRDSYQRMQGR